MIYAEIVVNVPIRRTFARRYAEPPVEDERGGGYEPNDDDADALQTYHYHLPPELEGLVEPGHLVWVPFGAQEVQGFVLRLADRAPVETRSVLRLARPEPVLTPAQLELASWIAGYYVAPASEAVRLFLPPGFLTKADGQAGIRAKREEQIEWTGGNAPLEQSLALLGRDTYGSKALEYVMWHAENQPGAELAAAHVKNQCGLPSVQPIRSLIKQGLVAENSEGLLHLAGSVDDARLALRKMRRVERYVPIIEWLMTTDGPVWKSELYAGVDASLKELRELQAAGLVRIAEQVRFRDPLRGRTYAQTEAPPFTDEQTAVWEQIPVRRSAAASKMGVQREQVLPHSRRNRQRQDGNLPARNCGNA